jgi:hypothetical protein
MKNKLNMEGRMHESTMKQKKEHMAFKDGT